MSEKVRKTLTLDPDVVEALGDDPASLSSAVNSILRRELERRARRATLGQFLDDLDERFGAPDPQLVEHYRRLLASS